MDQTLKFLTKKKNLIFYLRSLRNLIFYKLGKSYPFSMAIWITYRCNQNCIFCHHKELDKNKELSKGELFNIIDQMSEMKVPFCAVSGGEPLLRKDVTEIGSYMLEKDIKNAINTNGLLLTKKKAKNLIKAYETFIVSLDGFERTHNFIRRMKTAYKRTVRGIRNLNSVKEENLVGVNFVMNKYNYHELLPLIKFLKELETDFISIQPVNFLPSLFPPPEEAKKVIDKVLKVKRKNPGFIKDTEEFLLKIPSFFAGERFECDAGELYCIIEPDGKVLPCSYFFEPIGDLKNQPLREILKSKKLEGFKIKKRKCDGCLMKCTIEISDVFRSPLVKNFKRAPKAVKIDHFG